jgi:hypothetical protein
MPAVQSRLGVFRMNVIALIVSFVLFLGGLALMGFAAEFIGWQGVTFIGGVLCIALSIGLPVHVLTRLD